METHQGPKISGTDLIECQICQLIHRHPLPDATDVEAYYQDDRFYAEHSPPDWFVKERKEYLSGLWDSYFEYLSGFLSPYLPVVDYGCGAGWLVDYLTRHCFYVLGIEPSESAKTWATAAAIKRISPTIKESYIEKAQIVLSLVLEHISNPAEWLRQEIVPYLDGRLIVVVPNDFSSLQMRILEREKVYRFKGHIDYNPTLWFWDDKELKKHCPWFVSPVHINYFTPISLRHTLRQAGLNVTYESATFPMELAILLGYDYRGDDIKGRKLHNFRLQFEKYLGQKAFWLYRQLHKRWGIGRELIFVAEKMRD